MKPFCADTLAMPRHLRPEHGVLRAPALLVTTNASRAADHLLDEARREAARLTDEARLAARDAVRREQEKTAFEASRMLRVLQQSREILLDQAGEFALDLAQQLFDRLLLEVTPRERLAAMFRRVRLEAPGKLVSAVVWVHPDDQDQVSDSPWELKTDPALPRGSCRLEAASGEWRAEFELAAQALKQALSQMSSLAGAPSASAEDAVKEAAAAASELPADAEGAKQEDDSAVADQAADMEEPPLSPDGDEY